MLRRCLGSTSALEQPPTAMPRHKARPSQNWPKITTYDHVHQIFITPFTRFRRGVLCDRGFGNKLQLNSNRNSYIFIQENALENVVWEMSVILSWPQCVNMGGPVLNVFWLFHCQKSITSLNVECKVICTDSFHAHWWNNVHFIDWLLVN